MHSRECECARAFAHSCELNIYRTDLDVAGVLVYLCVKKKKKKEKIMFMYCRDAFRATHHAVLVVVGHTE